LKKVASGDLTAMAEVGRTVIRTTVTAGGAAAIMGPATLAAGAAHAVEAGRIAGHLAVEAGLEAGIAKSSKAGGTNQPPAGTKMPDTTKPASHDLQKLPEPQHP